MGGHQQPVHVAEVVPCALVQLLVPVRAELAEREPRVLHARSPPLRPAARNRAAAAFESNRSAAHDTPIAARAQNTGITGSRKRNSLCGIEEWSTTNAAAMSNTPGALRTDNATPIRSSAVTAGMADHSTRR